MKRTLYAGRFGSLALIVLTFIVPVFAQRSLTTALDFDGNGVADYYTWRGTVALGDQEAWSVHTNNDINFIHPFGEQVVEFEAPGDYDGDSKGDIATFNDLTSTWRRIESSTGAVVTQVFGLPGDLPVQRDYDGDGKTDLAVIRFSGGALTWHVLRSSDGITTTLGGACGFTDTDFEAPGDYDGDGLFDAAVQRPQLNGTSTFIICFSAGGTQSIPWGTDSDLNNIADYDGDGKSDIAVTREGPGGEIVWDIRRSSNGSQMLINWGIFTEDSTVQNDYDGDGRAEVAVYRGSEARFFIKDTVNSNVSFVPWGLPGDYPLTNFFLN
jgi:hypothetical protein